MRDLAKPVIDCLELAEPNRRATRSMSRKSGFISRAAL
jgi:hypothetical protein